MIGPSIVIRIITTTITSTITNSNNNDDDDDDEVMTITIMVMVIMMMKKTYNNPELNFHSHYKVFLLDILLLDSTRHARARTGRNLQYW